MPRIRILIADDHPIIRSGLTALIQREKDMQIVGEALDGHEALELVLSLSPDVAVLDVRMPKMNGAEIARLVKEKCPNVRMLVLSFHEDESYATDLRIAGASGYLVKHAAANELVPAIRAVAAGGMYFKPPVAREIGEIGAHEA